MSLPETFKALTPTTVPQGNPEFKDLPLQKPGKDQVLVKMAYSGLCNYDIFLMKNSRNLPQSFLPPISGVEGSGTIVAVGEDLKTPFKVGDRVHVLRNGTIAEYTLAETIYVYPIQGDLSFEEAAYHFVNPGTVHFLGALAQKGGHKAVVNTGAGSTLGKQLIKYFKSLGIKTVNIVRKDHYIEELTKEGGDYVLNSEAPDFEAKLKEITTKENATMAADCVGGELVARILKTLPEGSSYYCYGNLSGAKEFNGVGYAELMGKSLSAINLNQYVDELMKKGELRKVITEVHSLLPTIFTTKSEKVFGLNELDEAVALTLKGTRVLLKTN